MLLILLLIPLKKLVMKKVPHEDVVVFQKLVYSSDIPNTADNTNLYEMILALLASGTMTINSLTALRNRLSSNRTNVKTRKKIMK